MTVREVNGRLVARFAAVYAALALVLIAAGLGAYAAYMVHGPVTHRVVRLEQRVGDENLTRLADAYINQRAQQSGLAVMKIVVSRVEVKGDQARVHAVATLTDGVSQQTVAVVVVFHQGTWQAQGIGSG